MSTREEYLDQFVDLISDTKDHNELKDLLKSLLTQSELIEIPKRFQIVKMLQQGLPQREIAKTLGVGIATVTRGSNALKSGKFNKLK